jgi:hypothetical protein
MVLRSLPGRGANDSFYAPRATRVVPEGVFDAFRLVFDSDVARVAATRRMGCEHAEVTASNPPGMVFILRQECDFLPRELGRRALHPVSISKRSGRSPHTRSTTPPMSFMRAG